MVKNVEVHTKISTTSHLGHAMRYCQGKPHYTHGGKVTKRAMFNYGINCPDDPKQALKVMKHTQKMGNYHKDGTHDIREIKTFIGIDPHNPDDVKLATKINTAQMKLEHPHCQINSTAQCDGKSGLFHFHNNINPTNPITLKSVTHTQESCNRAIVISRNYMKKLKPTKHHTFYVHHGLNVHSKITSFKARNGKIKHHVSYINFKPVKRIRHNQFKHSWMNQLGDKLDNAIADSVSKDDYVNRLEKNGVNVERWHMKTNKKTGQRELHYYKTQGRHPNQAKLIKHGSHKGYYLHEKKHYTYSAIINGRKYIARDKKFGYDYNPNNITKVFKQNLADREQWVHDTYSQQQQHVNAISDEYNKEYGIKPNQQINHHQQQSNQSQTSPKSASKPVKHDSHIAKHKSIKHAHKPNNDNVYTDINKLAHDMRYSCKHHTNKLFKVNDNGYRSSYLTKDGKVYAISSKKVTNKGYTQHYYRNFVNKPVDALHHTVHNSTERKMNNSHIKHYPSRSFNVVQVQPMIPTHHGFRMTHSKPIMPHRPLLADLSKLANADEREHAQAENDSKQFNYDEELKTYANNNSAYLSDLDAKASARQQDEAIAKDINDNNRARYRGHGFQW